MAAIADYRRDRAFERMYSRYVREVYRYVLAVLRNPAEAEDVTQTTFLNAYRAMLAGEEPQKPHNWLIAIAHNACRSRLRFTKRRPTEVPLDAIVEQLEVPEAERPNVRELMRALGELPVNQRAAITMRELEGRSHSEIAETLGVTVPAAEALIGRARRTLRSQAHAIRGLIFVQLPQSLRHFARPGEAAGGAAGSAAIAKAVAVIAAAGVVAGGATLAGRGNAAQRSSALPQRLELGVQVVRPALHRAHARTAQEALRAEAARTVVAAAPSYRATASGRRPRFDTSGDTPDPQAPDGATAPHAERASPASTSTSTSVSTPVSVPSRPRVRKARPAGKPTPVAKTVTAAKTAVDQVTEPVEQAVSTVVAATTAAVPPVPPLPSVPTVPSVPPPPALPQPPSPPPVTIP
jgi:RNA polymerase sigma factor (sigma-70 family)